MKMTNAERNQYTKEHILILKREELEEFLMTFFTEEKLQWELNDLRIFIMREKELRAFNCLLDVRDALGRLVAKQKLIIVKIGEFKQEYKKIF